MVLFYIRDSSRRLQLPQLFFKFVVFHWGKCNWYQIKVFHTQTSYWWTVFLVEFNRPCRQRISSGGFAADTLTAFNYTAGKIILPWPGFLHPCDKRVWGSAAWARPGIIFDGGARMSAGAVWYIPEKVLCGKAWTGVQNSVPVHTLFHWVLNPVQRHQALEHSLSGGAITAWVSLKLAPIIYLGFAHGAFDKTTALEVGRAKRVMWLEDELFIRFPNSIHHCRPP